MIRLSVPMRKLPLLLLSLWGFVLPCLLCGASAVAAPGGMRLVIAPQTLRANEATLIWDRPDGAGSGTVYEVLRDGVSVGSTTRTHFTAKGLMPERDYAFAVRARTAAGAEIAASAVLPLRTPALAPVVSVVDHGARGDGVTLNTKAIQAAIDACPRGGEVLIPEGVFLSGALFLKSDLTFRIAKGGVLQGSSEPKDYTPFTRNRFEGWEMDTHASLLNAGRLDRAGPANVRNLSICGEGTISGGGCPLSDAIRAAFPGVEGLRARGRLVLIMNAENVEVAGLTLEETPCWTLHYIYSENVSLHGLTIRSDVRNGDGIDPDSSRNSYIFNCTFDTGDDCIAIKSGKNPEGNIVNRPTENVRIFDCRFDRGHGISIGSEMSGGVRNVLVEDCVAGNLLHGLQIKATKDRGGFVENVTVRNCALQKISVLTELDYNNDGQPAPTLPLFRGFRFQDIDLTKAEPGVAIIVNGYPDPAYRTKDVVFENIRLRDDAVVRIDQVEDITFIHVATEGGKPPAFEITRSGVIHR